MTARILQFSGDNLIEYSLVDGTVTTTSFGGSYNFESRYALFNYYDNKIYAISIDGGSSVRIVKFNPYTNNIELVASKSASSYLSLLDVQGECVWFFDDSYYTAFSTEDFSQIHHIPNLYDLGYAGNSIFAAPGGRLIMNAPQGDEIDPWYGYTTYSVITASGGSYDDDRIGPGVSPGLAESIGHQAPYIYTGDKFFLGGGGNLPEEYGTGIIGSILNLTELTFFHVYVPGVADGIVDAYSPRWDRDSNVVVVQSNHGTSGHTCGATISASSGVVLGTFGESSTLDTYDGFYDEPNTLGGGVVIGWSSYYHVGFFNATAPSTLPISVVPGEDWVFEPFNGLTVVPSAGGFWTKRILTVEV